MIRLIKILYGIHHPPNTFYDNPWGVLLGKGSIQSKLDPCLFLKSKMICLVYVDGEILDGNDKKAFESEIKILGVSSDEHRHKFGLRDEGEVGGFNGNII